MNASGTACVLRNWNDFMKTSSILKLSLVAGTMFATTACGNSREIRGYVFDKELADAILPGVDNRDSVLTTLGNPTMRGTFDQTTWYYVSTKVRVRPVFWPDAKEHRVLIVGFNDRGIVDTVNNLDLSDMREVVTVKDKTATRGREQNFFEQIFGSIGRFGGAGPGRGQGQQGPTRGPNG